MSRPKIWFASKVSQFPSNESRGKLMEIWGGKKWFHQPQIWVGQLEGTWKTPKTWWTKTVSSIWPTVFNTQNGGDFQLETKTV